MVQGWTMSILRTFLSFSRQLLDGSGVLIMEPSPLQSGKLGFGWPRPMKLFTRFTWLWDSSQPSFTHRSELPLGQQKKTHAWNAVKGVNTTVHEHAHIYTLTCDAYRVIHWAYPKGPDLPLLVPHDLHVATLALGSDKVGQCNKQQSWIWGFGQKSEDDSTWMNDCKQLLYKVSYAYLYVS